MSGRSFLFFVASAVLAAPVLSGVPVRNCPVLPEVSKHLAEGKADIQSSTFAMARAHALLVLLGPEMHVSAKFEGVPEKKEPQYIKILDSAMHEWEKDLDGTVHFVRVPDGQDAPIVVRFKPSVTMRGEQVAGYVNWKRTLKPQDDGTVSTDFTADLQIRVRDLNGEGMPSNAMRHAVMHEFGHVLGLDDSPRQGDIMGPLDVESPVSSPTALEIETVKNLRNEAQVILQEATTR